ncbi:MAG: hypothetical protein JJU45_20085 [Acidimicrobiia bacterium]|nr:hypothetical protein [Acidimicrobiia bacterium]
MEDLTAGLSYVLEPGWEPAPRGDLFDITSSVASYGRFEVTECDALIMVGAFDATFDSPSEGLQPALTAVAGSLTEFFLPLLPHTREVLLDEAGPGDSWRIRFRIVFDGDQEPPVIVDAVAHADPASFLVGMTREQEEQLLVDIEATIASATVIR